MSKNTTTQAAKVRFRRLVIGLSVLVLAIGACSPSGSSGGSSKPASAAPGGSQTAGGTTTCGADPDAGLGDVGLDCRGDRAVRREADQSE